MSFSFANRVSRSLIWGTDSISIKDGTYKIQGPLWMPETVLFPLIATPGLILLIWLDTNLRYSIERCLLIIGVEAMISVCLYYSGQYTIILDARRFTITKRLFFIPYFVLESRPDDVEINHFLRAHWRLSNAKGTPSIQIHYVMLFDSNRCYVYIDDMGQTSHLPFKNHEHVMKLLMYAFDNIEQARKQNEEITLTSP